MFLQNEQCSFYRVTAMSDWRDFNAAFTAEEPDEIRPRIKQLITMTYAVSKGFHGGFAAAFTQNKKFNSRYEIRDPSTYSNSDDRLNTRLPGVGRNPPPPFFAIIFEPVQIF